MTQFTILGAGGFIGGALVTHLRAAGHDARAVARRDVPTLFADKKRCGHVIYCVGLTADFRVRPLETAEAHVGLAGRVLAELDFDSFLYLSSTRVYAHCTMAREDAALEVQPLLASDLYNITKLAGEALSLSDPRPHVKVARLSNVYGAGMGTNGFLGQVLAEGASGQAVTLHQSLMSAKDYVSVADVVPALIGIAARGQARLYNVASGTNTTHDALVGILAAQGWKISAEERVTARRFPRIDIARLSIEFGAPTHRVIEDLPRLAAHYRREAVC